MEAADRRPLEGGRARAPLEALRVEREEDVEIPHDVGGRRRPADLAAGVVAEGARLPPEVPAVLRREPREVLLEGALDRDVRAAGGLELRVGRPPAAAADRAPERAVLGEVAQLEPAPRGGEEPVEDEIGHGIAVGGRRGEVEVVGAHVGAGQEEAPPPSREGEDAAEPAALVERDEDLGSRAVGRGVEPGEHPVRPREEAVRGQERPPGLDVPLQRGAVGDRLDAQPARGDAAAPAAPRRPLHGIGDRRPAGDRPARERALVDSHRVRDHPLAGELRLDPRARRGAHLAPRGRGR